MKCPNCHAGVEKDDIFCPECGSAIRKTGKNNVMVIILSLIVLAVIVTGIMFWLLSGKQDDSKSSSKTASKLQASEDAAENKSTKEKLRDGKSENIEKENEVENENKDIVKKTETEYVLQQSGSEYLSESDVQGMTAQQLNYAKNEIYARHGRRFDSPELQNYFNSKNWYTGRYDPKDFDANYSNSLLSDIEKKNAEFLRTMEYKIEPSGYQLDQ